MTIPLDAKVLGARMALLEFAALIENYHTPSDVLDALDERSARAIGCNVGIAIQLPMKWGDIDALKVNETVFIHKSIPKGWWDEYVAISRRLPGIGLTAAQMSFAPFTDTEMMQNSQPRGMDRWTFDLAMKYGIRDAITCPVGGRWIIGYWSKKPLRDVLPGDLAALYAAATFAALRLRELTGSTALSSGSASLTKRELEVLRLVAAGNDANQVAELLELGTETIRSHIKKAQSKLGARNRLHTVVQAIRLGLIA